MADAIVDLVSTGNTLKANDLVEVEQHHRHQLALGGQSGVAQAQAARPASHHRCVYAGCASQKQLIYLSTVEAVSTMEIAAKPLRLSTADANFEHDFAQRLHWSADTDAAIEQRVADILADVQQRGDAAVLEYAARFDGLQADAMAALELTQAELKAAFDSLPAVQRDGAGVCRQAGAQLPRGAKEGQRRKLELPRRGRHPAGPEGHAAGPRGHLRARWQGRLPLQRADERHPRPCGRCARDHHGACPRPRARRTRWCWPPPMWPASPAPSPSVARRPWRRWPTARPRFPKVDKITGPGNAYVASAKKRVFGLVGIDMIAGPSEILVLADGSTPADWVAMDLFSPGRARRAGAVHPAVPRCRLHRRRAGRHRPPAARHAARRHHRQEPE